MKCFLGWMGIALVSMVALGCAEQPQMSDDGEGASEETRQALRLVNGKQMNGTQVNGSYLNGIKQNGIKQNGIKQNGIKQNGIKQNGTSLEGVREDTGAVVEGMEFEGAEMEGVLGDDQPVVLHIADISDTEVPGMYTYLVTTPDGESICGRDAQNLPIRAMPLPGLWDYDTGAHIADPEHLTFACRGAALAKCMEMGYSRFGTWNDGSTVVQNGDFHDACVRLLRADYCGNGASHTQDGTLVDVFDKKGTQTETPNSGLQFEAEWGPDGATCIRRTRWATTGAGDVATYLSAPENAVSCGGRFVPNDTTCGTTWRAGGLIRNATGLNDHSSF